MKYQASILSFILRLIVIWRVALLGVALYAQSAFPFKPSFPYWESLLVPEGNPLLWSWGNFDGVHYLTIAKNGYTAQFTQAFFPLYPLFIRIIEPLTGSYLISGLLLSNLALILALYWLYKLIRFDHGDETAKRTLLYLLLFPTSFYFGALYSESLFLLLAVATFYAARRRKWWVAGLLGAAASATRVFGIFLVPALLIEWYQGRGKKTVYTLGELVAALFPIFLAATGMVAYMVYLAREFQDPFLFLNAQPVFGAQRSIDKIILLYQVFWRYAKMLATVDRASLLYYTVSLEAATGFVFLILSIISFKKLRLSYAVFAALSYITPTLTGTFSSLPRYVLIIFPAFIVLGLLRNAQIQRFVWATGAILLAINTALFVRGYWVA